MFFIGIFGVKQGQKEIGTESNVICPECGHLTRLNVIKQSSYFHIFFIPIFRWNVRYFAKTLCCGQLFELNAEAGKEFEEGKSGAISQGDLTRIGPQRRTGLVKCSSCGANVENSYRFCPHCGNHLT
ncbi:MAG: zinc ribbon domain-containing protein [Youngiibacter sp.]|nr:zinc ribbon domain-containing protein [Youngiibacter sp.]